MFFIDKYTPVKVEDREVSFKTMDVTGVNVMRLDKTFFHSETYHKLSKLAKDDSIPHIIFYGPEGSGKKTLIKLFLEMIYDKSVHKMTETKFNVSGSGNSVTEVLIKQSNYHIVIEPNNTNFDRYLVQDVVTEYAKKMPLNIFTTKKLFKTVLINNIDNLTYYAQTSLRRTMEKYSGNCRFIMWGRSLSKVIDPLISRCLSFRIPNPPESEMLEFLVKVSTDNKINITFDKYMEIISDSNCNIKKALWLLELYKDNQNSILSKIYSLLTTICTNDKINLDKINLNTDIVLKSEYDIKKALNLLKVYYKKSDAKLLNLLIKFCSKDSTEKYFNKYLIKIKKNPSLLKLSNEKISDTEILDFMENIKSELLELESLRDSKITQTSYDLTIKKICSHIQRGKTSSIIKIRDYLYRIMITNVSGKYIIRNIVENIINSDWINEQRKFNIIKASSKFEHNLVIGRRDIVHLEAFIQRTLREFYEYNKEKGLI